MLLKDYVFWKQAIPPHICDQFIKYGKQQEVESGRIGKDRGRTKKEVRDSDIGWINAKWVWDWILEPVNIANRDIFKYNMYMYIYIYIYLYVYVYVPLSGTYPILHVILEISSFI